MKTKMTYPKRAWTACAVVCLSYMLIAQNPDYQQKEAVYAQWTWQEAQISSVFSHLSQVSGVDFVIDPAVTGNVTLSVTNKSWREVCDIICKMKQLIPLPEKNYIYIMLEKDYINQQQNQEMSRRSLSDIRELDREIIKLSNTTASEMVGPVGELLSTRGKVTVVTHNNSLIIYDLKENIKKVRELVMRLDIEVEQVSISAKIIEVGSGTTNNIGIQWSLFDNKIQHLPGATVIPGALEKASFGIMSPQRFSIALEYLFSENRSNVIAQPQITTVDNKEARIFMGSQIPITYQDEAKNTLVRMVDAGTELTVTPHVTSEGRIKLQLKPSKKSYQMTVSGPIINEQSAQTNVVVNDGETVVIAGLTSDDDQQTEGGIPILKDIPIVGYLFKKVGKAKEKKDLLIFVTPHIIKRDLSSISQKPNQNSMVDTGSGSAAKE